MLIVLQLVSSAYKKMNTFVSELSRTVGLIQSPSFSRQPSLRSQVSASSPIREEPEPMGYMASNETQDMKFGRLDVSEDGIQAHECMEPSDGAYALPDEKRNGTAKLDYKKREGIAAEAQRHQLQLSNLNSGFSFIDKTSSKEKILRAVNDKTVDLDQRMLEETIRLDNLSKQIGYLDINMNDKFATLSGRFCNGDYIWRVTNFSARYADIKNKNLSAYSPPIYTSQFGYKCCIRLGVSCKKDQSFLSLYFLFMKGEYDNVLEWPFNGSVTLGLLDSSPNYPKKHIVDSLQSNPNFQAFQRPTGYRNEKSFGFTNFFSIDDLHPREAGDASYIVNDTITVRARLVPRDSFGTF